MIMELAIMMQFWSFPYSLLSTSKFKDLLNQEMHHVSRGQAEFPADVVSAFNPVNNPRDGRKGSCDKNWDSTPKAWQMQLQDNQNQ